MENSSTLTILLLGEIKKNIQVNNGDLVHNSKIRQTVDLTRSTLNKKRHF